MNTAPSQTVELELGGRLYGAPVRSATMWAKQTPPPEVGKIFLEDLLASSAILLLPPNPSRDQVLAAYKSDIEALTLRRNESDTFMRRVLETAIVKYGSTEDRQGKEWEMLQGLLMPLGVTPQIPFTAERAALPPFDLASWLKNEYRNEIDRIARRIATTLQYLADHNVIGLIDFPAADICKFHYFRWDMQTTQATINGDREIKNGWVSFTQTVTDTSKLSRTRHTHHLVNAGIHMANDYKLPMPQRIKDLLTNAPAWLKQNLLIVDGTETLAEELTTVAGSVTTSTRSVVRYDPAIVLGPFVLAGWNQEDVKTQANTTDEEASPSEVFVICMLIIAFIGVLVAAGIAIHNTNVQAEKTYQAYLEKTSVSSVGVLKQYEAAANQAMAMPIQCKLKFGSAGPTAGSTVNSITLSTPDANNPGQELWSRFGLTTAPDRDSCYGNINLTAEFGLPVVIHVQKADKNSIVYTVTVIPPSPEEVRLGISTP